MPTQPSFQFSNSKFVNTIQVMEELVDRVFRKHHFTAIPSPPPTLRLTVLELEEMLKAA